MWADGRHVEHVRDDLPAHARVERHRGEACVAPEDPYGVAPHEIRDRIAEKRAADSSPDEVPACRHTAQLIRGLALVGLPHERRAAGDRWGRRCGCADGSLVHEQRAEVPRRRLVIAIELRAFAPQAGAELRVAKRDDLGEGRTPQPDANAATLDGRRVARCTRGGHAGTVERPPHAG